MLARAFCGDAPTVLYWFHHQSDIAGRLGYQVVRIDLFRTRFATATQSDLREEVVVLRWPGRPKAPLSAWAS